MTQTVETDYVRERRGRIILGAALLWFAGLLVRSCVAHQHTGLEDWINDLAGYGPLLALLYFAFRGGSFSIGVLRFILVFFGGVLAIVTILAAVGSYQGNTKLSLAHAYSLRSAPIFIGYLAMVWIFFFSRSVRAYIDSQRAIIRPLRERSSADASDRLSP